MGNHNNEKELISKLSSINDKLIDVCNDINSYINELKEDNINVNKFSDNDDISNSNTICKKDSDSGDIQIEQEDYSYENPRMEPEQKSSASLQKKGEVISESDELDEIIETLVKKYGERHRYRLDKCKLLIEKTGFDAKSSKTFIRQMKYMIDNDYTLTNTKLGSSVLSEMISKYFNTYFMN